ncbi:hypothetical protein AVEN_147509-1 [Araneus ventricosus]|uniref:Uncharacterized protein n=1 Tax=Araneus ventricosus TaxID=182803 RepID=A0A4Y2JKZ9_ARAVE|nr:hypothetical protein AVEN_147509-1 [Araneus ventricosus]
MNLRIRIRSRTRILVSDSTKGTNLTHYYTKPKDTPAKCAYCGGDHMANYSKCPKNPLQTTQSKKTAQVPSAAWTDKRSLERVKAPPPALRSSQRLARRSVLLENPALIETAHAQISEQPSPPQPNAPFDEAFKQMNEMLKKNITLMMQQMI